MSGFLLDTHIWYWCLTGSPRLPERLRIRLDQARDRLWVSPVSIWELGMLAEKGRVELDRELKAWAHEALVKMPVRDAALNRAVALRSHEIRLEHRDPADRLLAATALVYQLDLATVDQRLLGLDWLPSVSS